MHEQMKQLKEEHELWNDYRNFRPSQHYEEQIDHVNHYLKEMDRFIREKEEMVNIMRDYYEKMRV